MQPLAIGPHILANNLALAPMAGITERPFRRLCREWGAGLAVSEMIPSRSMLAGDRLALSKADHTGEEGSVAVQIAGGDPDLLAEAARWNEARGADIIDINMGCPAKTICKQAAGSALMRDEALVGRILEAVVGAVSVPVTLKMRTGWDRQHKNAPRLARMAEEAGIQALAVHGRTRADRYRGDAEYETIAAVKEAVSLPVWANGDIRTPEDAARVLDQSGADGVMIGRGAQGRPWLFQSVAHYLATGEVPPEPGLAERGRAILMHLEGLKELYGSVRGARVARKHLGWYAEALPGEAGRAFRAQANKAEALERQEALVRGVFLNDDQEAA
ncbi:tRNA dihydrouridine synthase DusB [Thiohalorhabdus denitrificans]|uniref:tRNA dihydrouridine synthase DusB n=1 Tax=Thiohalorhabdus denitrificans TaxID=381306 RepID=UPI0022B0FEA5|nr:tRNA dihydrouridine synthase DusB [Thiohalorhabdus denitrificans]